jgi:hypothetical protein
MDDVVAFILSEILSLVGENTESGAMALGGHIGRAIGVTFGFGFGLIPLTRKVPGSGSAGGTFVDGLKGRARESWRGAVLLGFAMIARGEIGLL